jgi:chromosomal replication initiation ATPase DnaA
MSSSALPVISKPMTERIIRAACAYFDISEEQLTERSNETTIVYRRNLVMYLIKDNVVNISQARIGHRLGLIGHSTVSRAIDTIAAQKNIYAQTKHDLNSILEIANNLA